MNRLVLVGNGYDLAAGLKTSYESFLIEYFISGFKKVYDSEEMYEDNILKIEKINPKPNKEAFKEKLSKIDTLNKLLKSKLSVFKNPKSEHVTSIETLFDVNIKSNLMRQLLTSTTGVENWKDIESFYFNKLVECYNRIESFPSLPISIRTDDVLERYQQQLIRLNDEFEDIKLKLSEYLEGISKKLTLRNSGYPTSIINNVNKPMTERDFESFFNKNGELVTKNEIVKGLIVNFNYTSLLSQRLNWNVNERKNIETIYIHGSTYRPKEIIFGYGDDTHPMYSTLELTGEDEYLKHMKSFRYPLSKNYLQLMNFLEYDQFEVQVAGHSLGLSDRVLLKSIFEHENCKCIRLLHRGRPNEEQLMSSKYMALSRHFDNKKAMRNKTVPYESHDIMR